MYVDKSEGSDESAGTLDPLPTVPARELGWSGPNKDVAIAGVIGEVAVCYNDEGTPVAAIDRAGRLGVHGLYVVDGPRLSATPKTEGDQA